MCLLEVLYSKPQTLLSFNQTKCNVHDFIFPLCDVCLLLPIVIADMYANPDVLLGPPSTFISSQFIVIFPIFSVLFALHTEHSLNRGQTISLEVKQHLWRSNNIFGAQTISLEGKQYLWWSNNIFGGQTISLEVKQYLWRSNNIFGGHTLPLKVKQYLWRSNNIFGGQTISLEAKQPNSL